MRICVIGDYKESYSSKKLLEESVSAGKEMFFVPWKNIIFDSANGEVFLNKEDLLSQFDAVILRSSITSLTPSSLIVEYCQHNDIRLLNKNFYLRYQSVNKLRQQMFFQAKKIPCLDTIFGESASFSFLKTKLDLPFIAKLASGSLGKQVFKINTHKEFIKFIQQRKKDKQLYLFQKFYSIKADYRVFIIGKKVFGPMERIAPNGEWRTNIPGSRHKRAEEKKEVLELAASLIQKTGLEFAGLDILIDSDGTPRLIEINTMACFRIFDKIDPEVNVAKRTVGLLDN